MALTICKHKVAHMPNDTDVSQSEKVSEDSTLTMLTKIAPCEVPTVFQVKVVADAVKRPPTHLHKSFDVCDKFQHVRIWRARRSADAV